MTIKYSKKFGHYSQSVGNMLSIERGNGLHDVTPPKICKVCGKGYGYVEGHKRINHSRCSRIKQKLYAKENKNG